MEKTLNNILGNNKFSTKNYLVVGFATDNKQNILMFGSEP